MNRRDVIEEITAFVGLGSTAKAYDVEPPAEFYVMDIPLNSIREATLDTKSIRTAWADMWAAIGKPAPQLLIMSGGITLTKSTDIQLLNAPVFNSAPPSQVHPSAIVITIKLPRELPGKDNLPVIINSVLTARTKSMSSKYSCYGPWAVEYDSTLESYMEQKYGNARQEIQDGKMVDVSSHNDTRITLKERIEVIQGIVKVVPVDLSHENHKMQLVAIL